MRTFTLRVPLVLAALLLTLLTIARANAAPPAPVLAEVIARLRALPTESYKATAEARDAYQATLVGAKVAGWQGWVARIGGETRPSFVVVFAEDPYAAPAKPDPSEAALPRRWTRSAAPAEVVLEGLAGDYAGLVPGQRVTVAGTIAGVDGPLEVQVRLTDGRVTPGPNPLTETGAAPVPAAPLAGLRVAIERTACFGSCPIYRVELTGDGKLRWVGKRFVGTIGEAERTVPPEVVARVVRAIERAQFATLADRYDDRGVTDQPSAIVTFEASGAAKRVSHYHGDLSAPARLSILEDQLDLLLDTARWIGPPR